MKKSILKIIVIASLVFMTSCEKGVKEKTISESNKETNDIPNSIENSTIKVVLKSDVKWSHLNPKRGDLAPKAGTLWGDRNGTEATGFLLKPNEGFKSPPHIHNVSYRGIVINGLIHNDDPNADNMWMPEGSFWTQPKGEIHITAAKGSNSLAYIEIEKGPYLVLPKDKAFDSGERPINMDKSNIVWLGASDIKWINQSGTSINNAQMAVLWGNSNENELNGKLVKLPAGFSGGIYSKGSIFGAVVIKGEPSYFEKEVKTLEAGSYFSSTGEAVHKITSSSEKETILYVRTNGELKIYQD